MLKYLLANDYWSINEGKWTGTKLLQQSAPPHQFVCYFPPLLADKYHCLIAISCSFSSVRFRLSW